MSATTRRVGTFERACNRMRAQRRWRAAARADFEQRIVDAETQARKWMLMRAQMLDGSDPDTYGMHLVHAERYLDLAKRAKRDAIRLQHAGNHGLPW